MSDVNFFKADLRELEFALFEQFQMEQLFASKPYDHFSKEDATMILKEANTLATEVIGPTMRPTDREGCTWTPEGVKAPESLKKLWNTFYDGGWNTLTTSEEDGGQGAPNLLGLAVTELLSAANTAFNMYPGLTGAACAVIRGYGSPEQRELYVPKMMDGSWGGTMVLTEPNAGSDVGLGTTKAIPNGDGTFQIVGNKIFISGGDHDLSENIVHLVLARVEGAPKGTRGLSLFIVPKFKVGPDGSVGELNDVICTRIEEKMGIHASSTAALAFGENGNCTGYLLGGDGSATGGHEPGEGMRRMFMMMNAARIGVGIQSLSVASTAYLNAVAYSRERLQGGHYRDGRPERGAVPIIQHPDVRRMLLEMKAYVEGCRALIYYTVRQQDQVAVLKETDEEAAKTLRDYYDLFVPLVKSYISDVAVHVTSLGMQVHGGAGYTGDYPAEQYMRDSRIFPIYEGTNGIQAMDLVGRKLMAGGGAGIGRFMKEMGEFVEANKARKGFEQDIELLGKALESFGKVLGKALEYATQDKRENILLGATRFMESMSKILISKLLLDAAFIADDSMSGLGEDSPDRAFYQGKIASGQYFARNILPTVFSLNEMLIMGDLTPMEIPDAGFSTSF